jgi:L-glutamine-phosphate cytidylyltransferase
MKAIVIGAGRGSRLGTNTDEMPKALVPVMGRPMLDWVLEAFAEAGIERRDVVFIAGYAEEVVRRHYADLTFVRNAAWESNNILGSLLCAREHLTEGFISSYADIVYEGAIVKKLVSNPRDIVLGCDTAWRRRYVDRSQHPESDAEKLRADGERVVELSRRIPSELADGEFIGVMKLSKAGSSSLVRAFDEVASTHSGKVFREGRSFERAYLIDLLAYMLEQGTPMFREDTRGGYMEIDTEQDLAHAAAWWAGRPC